MPPNFPAPSIVYPIILADGSPHMDTVFLRAVIDHPRWEIGEYTYASSESAPQDWARYLAPYLYPFSPERLIIGRFCQIADSVRFITASANHRYDGFSSYPFAIFHREFEGDSSMPGPGPDTIIGNDVWIGQGARILPGAEIGDGVIIGAGAVVGGRIAPYQIMTGSPAQPLRARFAPDVIAQLLTIRWWDWPIAHIMRHQAAICGADLDALAAAAAELPGGEA
ncbi:CatB-related O-acetyltransferase [Roseinatronobacter monicus]|uniref:CatB-related O-acetyltransferase n=1 Tax=Roseinatronobacter monicus TaxID=393481 RepID=UPI003F2E9C37